MNRVAFDPALSDDSYNPDEVVVPGAHVNAFGFCPRIADAMADAGIQTVDQFVNYVYEHFVVDGGRFESGVGDLGPNATTVALLTMLLWKDIQYETIAPILDLTGCIDDSGDDVKFALSPEMEAEWQRQIALFRRDPHFGLVRQAA